MNQIEQKESGFLNRNQIKYIVILAMVIDHIAWAFVPMDSILGQIMHFIGRLTGPTMAFFLAEGYIHTKNVKKYAIRLAVFSLISLIPFVYFEFGVLPISFADGGSGIQIKPYPGVMYSLLMGLLAICLWDRTKLSKTKKVLLTIVICFLSTLGDWPIFDVLWSLFFFLYRENPRKKWQAFCIVGAICCLPMVLMPVFVGNTWWNGMYNLGIFMVPVLVNYGYNGKGGSRHAFHKWFFYLFYPLHLLILGVLKWIVFAS